MIHKFISAISSIIFFGSIILAITDIISFGTMVFIMILTSWTSGSIKKRLDIHKDNKNEKAIAAYFKNNNVLELNDHIFLKKPQVGYSHLGNLEVYYQNEKIALFSELKHFSDAYPKLIELAVDLSKTEPVTENISSETIKENQLTDFIKMINNYNIDIPDQEISEGLYCTTALLKQLDILEQKHPKTNRKLTKLYEYYLPILLDILKNYQLVKYANDDQNKVSAIEDKLMKTIILINEAIRNITASLFESEMMNLSADMSVLESILKKDGLIEEKDLNMQTLNQMNKQEVHHG